MADATSSKNIIFHKNQIVLREGQSNPTAYMVKRGSVTIYRIVNNRRVVLGVIKPGQFFGEASLLTGEPFHANAEADDYTELIPFDAPLLHGLLLKSPVPLQRLLRHLLERVKVLEKAIQDQPTNNRVLGVCQVLHLLHLASEQGQPKKRGNADPVEFSSTDTHRAIRNILLISQLELELILERLAKLGLIAISDVKQSRYEKNIFGELQKTGEQVRDRMISLCNPQTFLSTARNLAVSDPDPNSPFTKELEYIDIHAFAQLVDASPEMLYRKIGNQEVPEELFFLCKTQAQAWAREMGENFFKKIKRKRLKLEELETVDDIVMVDDTTLQEAFPLLGFHKLGILYSAAQPETRDKILANLSRKMAKVIHDEGRDKKFSDTEVADVEHELMELIKQRKGQGPGKGA
ncbi:cyclic nucleotide-binding domain-containing protein [Desulfocurvibacter africanus]|uniref:cyclic nucleotide-binding domain-containing protein n=1 Tax=Desulfocurvibacter africanus TaxID=873 RepID=UPI002FDB0381